MSRKDQSSDDPSHDEETQQEQHGDELATIREQLATIGDELEEALREKAQFRTMAQRSEADLINYRRRADEEKEELRRTASSQLLLKILSAVDDLNRAISFIPDDGVTPGWLDGLRLVKRNINNILDSEGVTKIEAEGRPFEPWEFEAVQYQETPDVEEGKVLEVLQEGYKHHGKVLRAAQVIVAKRPEPQAETETDEEEEE